MWKNRLGDIGGSYGFNGTQYNVTIQKRTLLQQLLIRTSTGDLHPVFAPIKSGDIVRLKCVYQTENQTCNVFVKHENSRLENFNAGGWQILATNITPPIAPAVTLCESDDCVQII